VHRVRLFSLKERERERERERENGVVGNGPLGNGRGLEAVVADPRAGFCVRVVVAVHLACPDDDASRHPATITATTGY